MVHSFSILAWLPSWEWIVILVVALLLFGKRLPEVARSVGRGIVEFKKGVKGIEDDVEAGSSAQVNPPASTSSETSQS